MAKLEIKQLIEDDMIHYKNELSRLFNYLHSDNHQYLIDWYIWNKALGKVYGAFLDDKLVGMATALLIPKPYAAPKNFVLQVEDVAVLEESRDNGIGSKLIEHILGEARNNKWAYKCQLVCSDSKVSWYKRFGFKVSNNNMRIDI